MLQKNLEDSSLFIGADIISINPIESGNTIVYSSTIVTSFSDEKDQTPAAPSPTEEVPEEEQD